MILIAGATGRLGGLITRLLLEKGEDVRALVRDESAGVELKDAGASLAVGDLRDRDSLIRACSAVDAVITTANSMSRTGEDTVESVDKLGNLNLIDAAAAQGVQRFVFLSTLGAATDSPMPFMQAKAEAEERLWAGGMRATVLRPNFFMQTVPATVIGGPALAGQPVTVAGEGRRRHSFVSMADVARYAIAALEYDEAAGQTLTIGGPEPVSLRDFIVAFERELGRELTVNFVPIGTDIPGIPPIFIQLMAAMETFDSPIPMGELASRYGVEPTSVEHFVHAFAAAANQENRTRQPQ